MADYINKNILSQAYIHVEPTRFESEKDLEEFKLHLVNFARSRADFYLHPDVTIEIVFEEGSLIGRITFMGTLLLLIEGVSNYADFREGIGLLYDDSKRLAEYVVSESQFLTGSKHNDVIRLEARVGIVGSIHKVINQLERIKSGAGGTYSADELVDKLERVEIEIEKLRGNIEDDVDAEFVLNGLSSIVQELPRSPKPARGKSHSVAAIGRYQDRRRRLRAYFKK